ncbi:lysophospholipid acyltransferase family protein [Paucidesulfovibrio longus]|uniref:lysophospholipid acyltransferase family protein n=1 Tax=Paucidesulfovibrio longus TaxID=889 RepID=UPI001F489781|nr:GNAT family N-acyltransferase [Paucidesulfovibrio longus]
MEHSKDLFSKDLFTLGQPSGDPLRKAFFALMKRPLARLLCFKKMNSIYSETCGGMKDGDDFVDVVLDRLNVHVNINEEYLRNIPAKGPVFVVANHPFGIIDGLILIKAMRTVRPDSLIMANSMLGMIPEMLPYLIEVDPFGTSDSVKRNINGLKTAMRWLKQGHMIGTFPAGEVASLRLRKRMVRDPQWSTTVAGIIRKTGAQVVPMFFKGRHGPLFQALGLVHPRLRTVMLPRVNLKQVNQTVDVTVGKPITAAKMASFASDEEAINYLRFRTHVLRRFDKKKEKERADLSVSTPIARPWPREELLREIESLPEDRILVSSGPFVVFESGVAQRPGLLHEIGRLREETFRPVGEGTGRELDTDRFDMTYRHLVLWDSENQRLAGAYRFGKTDELLARQGIKGLYSSTLFKLRPELFEQMGPAMEMGRSFICSEYQRSYQPLLMLWKGIAEYVCRNPRYKTLFGCVSVSSDYTQVSRELMVRFLERHCSAPELANYAVPKRPPKIKYMKRLDISLPETAFNDIEDIGVVVGDIETDKSIPVLLKQYLKLGGKILAFNIDPDFNDCMDGLILVDLRKTEPRMLNRFMGADKAAAFLEYHKVTGEPDKAA